MTAKEKNQMVIDNATKAMRSTVRKVKADRKMRNQPMIIWKDGKVVRIKEEN